MGMNIENESKIIKDRESSVSEKNKIILDGCGINSLFTGLRDAVSDLDLDLNKKNPVISNSNPAKDWESITLMYMWGDLNALSEKARKSLTAIASIAGENTIHLMFREIEQNGEIKKESSVFDISDQDKKKEMLEKISTKFSTSLIS